MRATDQTTKQEVNQEKYIVDYQDKGGLKVAKHVVIHNDGNLFMDIEITEIQVFESSTIACSRSHNLWRQPSFFAPQTNQPHSYFVRMGLEMFVGTSL